MCPLTHLEIPRGGGFLGRELLTKQRAATNFSPPMKEVRGMLPHLKPSEEGSKWELREIYGECIPAMNTGPVLSAGCSMKCKNSLFHFQAYTEPNIVWGSFVLFCFVFETWHRLQRLLRVYMIRQELARRKALLAKGVGRMGRDGGSSLYYQGLEYFLQANWTMWGCGSH